MRSLIFYLFTIISLSIPFINLFAAEAGRIPAWEISILAISILVMIGAIFCLTRLHIQRKKAFQEVSYNQKLLQDANQKLLESKERTNALLDATPDMMFVFDQQGNFLDYHGGSEKLLLSPFGFIGKNISEVLPPDLAEQTKHHLGKLFHTQKNQIFEYKLKFENEIKEYEARLVLSGKFEALSIVRDVTEIKRKEREHLHLQTQLFHSAKLASIGILAAGLAHEINNPLTVISGDAQIMEEDCPENCPCDNLKRVKNIIAATDRISNIVNGLKTYARRDNDTIENVDIHQCLNETLSLFKGVHEKEKIEIKTSFHASETKIMGNMGKMQQVIMNMLSNSKDALESKKNKVISITTFNQKNSIMLEISDNGVGVPSSILPHLFDPFFTTKMPGKGIGLGLSICHTIVDAFGGKIEVNSNQDRTAFTIQLPTIKNI